MNADQLFKAQRHQYITILGRGSIETFESILDHLLAWDLLNWEEYEHVKSPGLLSRSSRNLLDVATCKGTRACDLFITDIVRKLHGHIAAVLEHLQRYGQFSKYECDEVQLPIYTPSQQARKLLDLTKAKGDDTAQILLDYIESEPRHIKPALGNVCLKYQEKLSSTLAAQSRFLTNYAGT
ncbi:hypothetical protein scyTo_0003178 [Scyliorhinus torazame]|uniref:CARD domain-containing protein n=1 Tax=Scyliorhinus torazame TaxID=75743 RepID=A0A401PLY2_SCYTO|nr:hypothetical protein [Scyliorhinus torazame]